MRLHDVRSFVMRFCLAAALVLSATPAFAKAPVVGDTAEHFTLRTMNPKLSGIRMLASRKFVGPRASEKKKALVLTFGASYCEPCKKELAELKTLAPKFADANTMLAAVVIDKDKEGIEKMRKLTVDMLGLTFPVLSDRFGILARRYQAEKLPMVVVIDANGKLSYIHSGFEKGAIANLMNHLGI